MDQKVFCSVCGAENEPSSKFCVSCGTKLGAAPAPAAEPEVVKAEPIVEESVVEPVVEESVVTQPETPVVEADTTNTYTQPVTTAQVQPQQQYYSAEVLPEDNGNHGVAIAALVCGIVSIVCCPIGCCGCFGGFNILVAIAAIVLGIIAIVKKFGNKGMAIAGIVCGGVAIIGTIGCIIFYGIAQDSSNGIGNDFQDVMEEIYDDMGMDYNF